MADSIGIPEARPLNDPPTDGITKLQYLDNSNKLASTSWDGSVRVHDTVENQLLLSHSMESGPLFSFSYQDSLLLTGGMDGSIRKFDMNSSKQLATLVCKQKASSDHSSDKASCSCLAAIAPGMVASAGWHQQFHLWDLRQQSAAATVDLPGKAFSMDFTNRTGDNPSNEVVSDAWVVIATSGRRTCFIDVRMMNGENNNPGTISADLILDRESTLKYQSRCVRFLPDGKGIAIGSIEGRAAIENLEELGRSDIKNFAFKCHRDGDLVYPVNAIDFHPGYGTFVTGGGDGTVVTWDGMNKKKLTTLPKFPTSISALAYHGSGSELAIASSYTFEEGEREHPKDEIYIRKMLDSECMPKKKS